MAKSWEAILSKCQNNEEDRLRFMVYMTRVALSHYLLYRNLIPADAFKRRRINDMVIYMFDGNTILGAKLEKMVAGIREAIQKKFVKTASVSINENAANPDEVTEVFTIHYSYNKTQAISILDDKGQPIIQMKYKGEKAFKYQVISLVKNIGTVIKELSKFNKCAIPLVKLTYYGETPKEYEPQNYRPHKETSMFKSEPTYHNCGFASISTDHTAIAIDLKTIYAQQKDITGTGEDDGLNDAEASGLQIDEEVGPKDRSRSKNRSRSKDQKESSKNEEAGEDSQNEHDMSESAMPVMEMELPDTGSGSPVHEKVNEEDAGIVVDEAVEMPRAAPLQGRGRNSSSSNDDVFLPTATVEPMELDKDKEQQQTHSSGSEVSPTPSPKPKSKRLITPRIDSRDRRILRSHKPLTTIAKHIIKKSPQDPTVYGNAGRVVN